jgi:hypothetical protein
MKHISYILLSCLTVGCADDSTDGDAQSPAVVDVGSNVTMQEALDAQQAWCDGLLSISDANEQSGKAAAKQRAEEVLDAAYGYQMGAVLFKPTQAAAPQTFRTTRAGALAYFVGGDPAYPADKGFALKGWTDCKIDNAGIFLSGNTASTMGNVTLTDKTGAVIVVDKSWQFLKDRNGQLRIMLHHSSLPYIAE